MHHHSRLHELLFQILILAAVQRSLSLSSRYQWYDDAMDAMAKLVVNKEPTTAPAASSAEIDLRRQTACQLQNPIH